MARIKQRGKILDNDGNIIQTIDEHNGLPSEDVNSILKYKDTLWIGTPDGIVRLNLRNKPAQQPFNALYQRSDTPPIANPTN
ncbi:MAG: hypothetical protein R2792_16445 [Saprospiraceae bacterium]